MNYRYLYPIFLFLAIFLPILLRNLELPQISNTYGKEYVLFELFGFIVSIFLILVAFIEYKYKYQKSLIPIIPFILFILVSFHFLQIITEYSFKEWDYQCYENAAKAILNEENPYTISPPPPLIQAQAYIYPPLLAQIMVGLYRSIETFSPVLFYQTITPHSTWNLVFYIYQCIQYFLIILAYLLSYKFARILKLNPIPASLLVMLIFICNNPLLRTLRHNQINLWILDLILIAIIYSSKHPIWSGLSIALGGHLKIYPLIQIFPLLITKQWKAILTTLFGIVLIFLLSTDLGRNFGLWSQFFYFMDSFPKGTAYRDNSIHSIIYNFLNSFGLSLFWSKPVLFTISNILMMLTFIVIFIWFLKRIIKREKSTIHSELHKYVGHSVDSLSLALLISPLVWEHQYVLAIPVILWSVICYGEQRPWLIGISSLFILGLPTFDVFPFSYHRIVGLFILLWATSGQPIFPQELNKANIV